MRHALPSPFTLFAFIAAFCYFAIAGLPLLADADVAWHIATGQWIWTYAMLPTQDVWSFTAENQPWYLLSWMFDLVAGAVYNIGGATGTYAVMLLALAAMIGLLCSNLLKRETISGNAMIFTLFLATLAFTELTRFRPQIIGFAMVLVFHRLLHDSRESPSRRLWTLPLLMLVWANSHGSFLAGFTLLGAYGLEAIATKRFVWLKQLLAISMVCAVAGCITPYGMEIFTALERTLGNVASLFIMEWTPFFFTKSTGVSAWVLVFVLACGLRETRIPLADKILSVAWFLAMLFSMRHAPIFVLVSAPYLAMSLDVWVKDLDKIRTHRADPKPALLNPKLFLPAVGAALCVIIASPWALKTFRGQDHIIPTAFDAGSVISFASKSLQGQYVFNDYNLGGRIILEAGGDFPIFIDGRAGTAYPDSVILDYIHVMGMKEGWEAVLEKWNVDAVMFGSHQPLTAALRNSQTWKEVYTDDVASVFTRVHPSADQTPR